jgi:tRNA threonylcarbamoyladenosine biosynthesis protein TsaB
MFLGIRTDAPLAEFYLYKNAEKVAEKTWQADRELAKGLLAQLEAFLRENELTFHDLSGLFVFRGPGSFTGLRIGLTVMNTIAYAQSIPIVGTEGDNWIKAAVTRLNAGENDQIVLPHYGAEARITKPKK